MAPNAPLYAAIQAPSTASLGGTVTATAVTSGGTPPLAYRWTLHFPAPITPPTANGTDSSFVFRPPVDGAYALNLSVSDLRGNESNASTVVVVTGPSPVSVDLQVTSIGSGVLNFSAVVTGATPPTRFLWSGPGAPVGWTNQSAYESPPLSAGTYNVSVTVEDSYRYTATHTVEVIVGSGSNSSPWWEYLLIGLLVAGVAIGAGLGLWYTRRRRRSRP